MPTTTRLVAAFLMAILGLFVSNMAIQYLPEGQGVDKFREIATIFGVLVGWFWTGPKIETKLGTPLGQGFVSAALLVFWVLFFVSLFEMLERSSKLRYDGPIEAMQDMVAIAFIYMRDMGTLDVVGALVVGGLLIGAICGWVARRFR